MKQINMTVLILLQNIKTTKNKYKNAKFKCIKMACLQILINIFNV